MSTNFSFKGKNTEAQKIAKRSAAQRVSDASAETKRAIRKVIVRAIAEGLAPPEAAREVRRVIGMSAQQAQAAMNYRKSLKAAGVGGDKLDRAMDRYTSRKIRDRASTIARTEVMRALNEGQLDSVEELQAEGLLTEAAQKEWIVTPDDALCPDCEEMDGVTIPVDEDFALEGPPAHPNCRCTIAITEG